VAFPLVKKLVGAQNFDGLAGMYLRAHPPSSPLMMHYGAEFPEFLTRVEQLAHIGYLADCARLDLALRRSYHAADAPRLDPQTFAIDPDDLLDLRLTLAPSSIILPSRWPLHDIWRFNSQDGAPKPRAVPQDVLVTRPEFDPSPHLLPEGAASWLAALGSGLTFGEAHDRTLENTPDFDLGAALTVALQAGAFASDHTQAYIKDSL
jgi:hypothetical protein